MGKWMCGGGIIMMGLVSLGYGAAPLSLSEAIEKALVHNPQVLAASAKVESEQKLILPESWPESPHLGFSHSQNMTRMQQEDGPMTTWFVSQNILFPTKYLAQRAMQRAKASASREHLIRIRRNIRNHVIRSYYQLFATHQILILLNAQKETLREVARIAESRYATGAAAQQDEMKAHVEQTKLAKEIITMESEHQSAQATLRSWIVEGISEIVLPSELLVPKLSSPLPVGQLVRTHSPLIKQMEFDIDLTHAQKQLTLSEYGPDIGFMFEKPFGSNAPDNAFRVEVEITVPLWFMAKQAPKYKAALYQKLEAEKNLENTVVQQTAEAQSLLAQAESSTKILKIYETSLMPQTLGTRNASRAAYRAGRVGILELLDSERMVYDVKVGYWRMVAKHAENIASLEEIIGTSISSLPNGE